MSSTPENRIDISILPPVSLDRMVRAVEKVRKRLRQACAILNDANILFTVVGLLALVKMKLTSYRDKDRTHLRDMIEIGLVDSHWPVRFESELGDRLQSLLDDPDG